MIKNLWGFFWRQRIWWMTTLALVLLLLGALLLLAASTPQEPFCPVLSHQDKIVSH